MKRVKHIGWGLFSLALAVLLSSNSTGGNKERNFPYVEIEGTAEDYQYHREWRSYYWREDFTFLLRDNQGKMHRVISREPTPWNNLRLGTTYTGLKVDWKRKPKVKVIGVKGIDRTPVEFYDLKLEPKNTLTAFIVRIWDDKDATWQDFYVNNWFHKWGPEADLKMLTHYANNNPNYSVYGYLNSIAAPFDKTGKELLKKYSPDWNGIIFHARVIKASNPPGYELQVLHFMGRNKKSLEYKVFHGDPAQIKPLDQSKPK